MTIDGTNDGQGQVNKRPIRTLKNFMLMLPRLRERTETGIVTDRDLEGKLLEVYLLESGEFVDRRKVYRVINQQSDIEILKSLYDDSLDLNDDITRGKEREFF